MYQELDALRTTCLGAFWVFSFGDRNRASLSRSISGFERTSKLLNKSDEVRVVIIKWRGWIFLRGL